MLTKPPRQYSSLGQEANHKAFEQSGMTKVLERESDFPQRCQLGDTKYKCTGQTFLDLRDAQCQMPKEGVT